MTASVMPVGPNYTVKDVETIAAGKDVRARLHTLAPGEVIPWHSHSEIADHFFILGGELTVRHASYHVLGANCSDGASWPTPLIADRSSDRRGRRPIHESAVWMKLSLAIGPGRIRFCVYGFV
jgi:hypothetical protein